MKLQGRDWRKWGDWDGLTKHHRYVEYNWEELLVNYDVISFVNEEQVEIFKEKNFDQIIKECWYLQNNSYCFWMDTRDGKIYEK